MGWKKLTKTRAQCAAGTRGAVNMPRAKKPATAAEELAAEDRRKFAGFLSESHDELCLWRKCNRQPCQRTRRCRGELDECGARHAPKEWARVRRIVLAMRDGQSRCAAERAALAAETPKRIVIDFGMGKPDVFEIDAAGKWTWVDGSPGPNSKAMTRSEWLRAAPEGDGSA
jgi:hypothetical protein